MKMKRIFDNIRILDFTNTIAGPEAAAILGDNGAEVIKIEKPNGGDDARIYYPRIETSSGTHIRGNRGKKSLAVSLKDPDGAKIINELIKTADVIVENFRPGAMAKLGFGYENAKTIKPDIIYCSISVFGQTGPLSMKPGYDPIAQAMTGIMDLTGERNGSPTRVGSTIGDFIGAFNAAFDIASALYHRMLTGEGNYIDVSITDGLIASNCYLEGAGMGDHPTRNGKHEFSTAPYGIFAGNDGECIIVAPNNNLWAKLCNLMGKPELIDDPKFNTPVKRAQENLEELVQIIEQYLKSFGMIEEAVDILDKAGIPVAKILTTNEVVEHPHFIHRGIITELQTPKGFKQKNITGRGVHIHFSNAPSYISAPAPALGEHNVEIMKSLGKSDEEIKVLNDKWIL